MMDRKRAVLIRPARAQGSSTLRALILTIFAIVAQPPQSVRIRVSESGQADLTALVDQLATRTGIEVKRPRAALPMPIRGLAGSLTRTILDEELGSSVEIAVLPRELVVTVSGTVGRAALKLRLESLASRIDQEAHERSRYGMRALGSYRPNDPSRPTICLIHGMNSTSRVFKHMIAPLEEAGFGVVVYEFPCNRDLGRSAEEFTRDWARFRQDARDTRSWAIVAHSMGCLLARFYVEGPAYGADVTDLVLIAPPNHGSRLARAQPLLHLLRELQAVRENRAGALAGLSDGLGQSADDLVPDSPFLSALNRRHRSVGVRYHILAGDTGFLTATARRKIELQLAAMSRTRGLLGGLTKLAAEDLTPMLDEMTDGCGDGCIAVKSTRLDGVDDHETIPANHIELVRGPSLFPDPGPVVSMPFILKRLRGPEIAPAR